MVISQQHCLKSPVNLPQTVLIQRQGWQAFPMPHFASQDSARERVGRGWGWGRGRGGGMGGGGKFKCTVSLAADYDRSDWTRQCHRTAAGQVQAFGCMWTTTDQTGQDSVIELWLTKLKAYGQFGCMWTTTDQTGQVSSNCGWPSSSVQPV